ncbi:leucine-rich repeat-containing protein 70-like [Palaemon carinicauda]|uniref:leucine-rich repeat-containing protein 70-like n=1 Tax=Palaemon carinicauda TaxID=392227 RepID=UPI0035B5B5FF
MSNKLLLGLTLVFGFLVLESHGSSLRQHDLHGRFRHKSATDTGIVVCSICPDARAIQPCTCVCHNATSADIKCGSELTSCEQLTDILNVATPVSQYLRLVVEKTSLQCMLTNDIWGPVTFQEVILRENKFSALDNHAFANFNKSMKILNLQKNQLSSICFATFNNQPYLEILNLDDNKIMFIAGYGNMAVKTLKEIHLQHNLITSVQQYTFQLMPLLQKIDYSHNKISEIDPGAFSFEKRTTENRLLINLSNNSLENFSHAAISGIENVTLNLSYNKIQDLSEFQELLRNTNFKARIFLTGNPITCDPSLCWIIQNKTITKCFDNFECINNSIKLYNLTADDLGCDGLKAQ